MEKRGIRTRAARHAVNTSLQARLPRSLRASCPRHVHIPVHRPCGRRSPSPGPEPRPTLAAGVCPRTGTVDSREKVRPGTGREAGLGRAVAERTGALHSVSLFAGPHPHFECICSGTQTSASLPSWLQAYPLWPEGMGLLAPCRLQTDGRFFQHNGVVLISSGQRLDIEIRYRQRILFDEIPARFHLVSHQGGKDFIGADGILDLYLQQAPGIRIHGGFP